MLGTALVSVLGREDLELYATYRTPGLILPELGVKKWFMFRDGQALPPSVQLGKGDWIINAAGATPQRPLDHDGDAGMVRSNSLLPYELAEIAAKAKARLIHVTTDCVFSGDSRGRTSLNRYKEKDDHEARSFYGRTKSMGEDRHSRHVFNLRCSLVGPEQRNGNSLLAWFLNHPRVNPVIGFGDHLWNGVTTLAVSRVVLAVVKNAEGLEFGGLPRIHHLIPEGHVTKAELLALFANHFDKPSQIEAHSVGGVDRTLGTSHPKLNNRLWALAGYENPPTIEEMVAELSRWVSSGGYFKKDRPL
jgi:dTDP-4-dehydrorhamnose reductase